MIALLLIPLALAFAFSGFLEGVVDDIAEENGIEGFDPEEPTVYDDYEVEFGTNSPDTLTGTSGDDALFGLGQTDVIRGFAGDDLIEAGTNNDTVFGGSGDDLIGGDTGTDLLFGDRGDDTIFGNGGDDELFGNAGEDVLIGGGASDTLSGGPGDDLLVSNYLDFGDGETLDVSASVLAVLQDGNFEETEDVDFDALQDNGAFNGVDVSFLNEELEEEQGGALFGDAGDDILVLSGGDTAEGGSGEDLFVLNEDMVDENTVVITDYEDGEDVIVLEYDGEDEPLVEVDDNNEDALIRIGENLIARVEGGAGLSASAVVLMEAVAL